MTTQILIKHLFYNQKPHVLKEPATALPKLVGFNLMLSFPQSKELQYEASKGLGAWYSYNDKHWWVASDLHNLSAFLSYIEKEV